MAGAFLLSRHPSRQVVLMIPFEERMVGSIADVQKAAAPILRLYLEDVLHAAREAIPQHIQLAIDPKGLHLDLLTRSEMEGVEAHICWTWWSWRRHAWQSQMSLVEGDGAPYDVAHCIAR